MPVHGTTFLLPTPGNTMWRKSLQWLRRLVALWEQPVWSTLLALAVYSMLGARRPSPWSVTSYAYYNYLADAFLHGQLHLRVPAPQLHDLSFYNGHHYLYWAPLPAVVLMPFVAVFGVRFSDVVFTLALAALNVGLVALL